MTFNLTNLRNKKWRKKFISYWITDPFWGLLSYPAHYLLRYTPVGVNAAIGAFFGPIAAQLRYKSVNEQVLKNISLLRPDLRHMEKKAIAHAMWRNIGQGRSEYSILDKLSNQNRVTINNLSILESVLNQQSPIIFVTSHTGNWEIRAKYLIELGVNPLFLFQPEKNRFIRRIAHNARSRMIDSKHLLEASPQAMYRICEHLAKGHAIWIALDEYKNGQVQGPRFNRQQLIKSSNTVYVTRLAQRYGATIIPIWCRRHAGSQFTITFDLPITVEKKEWAVQKTISVLDALLEKHVLSNLDQWYMLPFLTLK
jgi:KDO2-lipid IV(A) lauroyltransferase